MRENNSGLQKPFQIGTIQGCRRGCVSCRGAYGQQILDALFLGKVFDIAQGAGHSPVLEGRAGIQAVILEIEVKTHHRLQLLIGFHQGRMSLTEVNNPIQWNHRGDEFVIAENPFQSLLVQHPPIVKEIPPQAAPLLLNPLKVAVIEEEHTPAFRTCVKKPVNAPFLVTSQASVDHMALCLRNEVGSDVLRKLIGFHALILYDFLFFHI